MADRFFVTGRRSVIADAIAALVSRRYLPGEPCSHRGCLSHVSHPCDGCGRIAGRYPDAELPNAEGVRPDPTVSGSPNPTGGGANGE